MADYTEGQTATMPDGSKIVFQGGAWVPVAQPDPVPAGEPEGNFFWQKGPIDTRGEQVGADIGKAIGSGIQQGVAGIASLPNLVEKGVNWMAGRERETMPSYGDITGAMTGAGDTLEDMLGLERSVRAGYEPETRAGKYAQTAAEFFAGAWLGGGGMAGARSVVAPAVISETAGQLTEGTAAEPYARVAGAVLGPTVVKQLGKGVTGVKSATPARRAAVKRLEAQGVKPTAGQKQGSDAMIYMEEAAEPAMLGEALDTFGDAVVQQTIKGRGSLGIKPVGSSHVEKIDSIKTQTKAVMDDLAANNTATLPKNAGSEFLRIYDEMSGGLGATEAPQIFIDLVSRFKNGGTLSGAEYQKARTILGRLLRSPKTGVPKAASEAMKVVDDAMEASIKAKGNLTDLTRYRDARAVYRDIEVARNAITRGSNLTDITPANLRSAAKSKDLNRLSAGKSPFSQLIDDGDEVIRGSRSSGTAERTAAETLSNLKTAGPAGAAGYAAGGLPGMVAGAVTGGALPGARNAAVASPAGQMLAGGLMPKLMSAARTPSRQMPYPIAISSARGLGDPAARLGPLLPQLYED